jgi:hypothetical protein
MKRLSFAAVFLVVVLFSTVSASAGIMYAEPWNPPPEPSGSGEPTTTACVAYGASGQKCKECKYTQYDENTMLTECKSRSYDASCKCWMGSGCEGQGNCDYR